ncbi:MAG: AzlC family ABC transporter permease [Clostridia bacterium]|nr:AzlC family ABC transporter permease [Clostridia bacterium]
MKKKNFIKGIKDGFPICIGYFSVAFAFGIFAVANGLSSLEALFISMTNVTSAGQLAAVPIIAGGGSFIELGMTQVIINLRYALMSISLSQKFDSGITLKDRLLIAFVNTDEVFAVATSQRGLLSKYYMFGLILTPFLGWSTGTIIGAVAGDILPSIITDSLSLAIYGMFIAIVVPEIKANKSTFACVMIAIALSCSFYFIPILKSVPSGFAIIICALVSAGIMAIVSPIDTKEAEENV